MLPTGIIRTHEGHYVLKDDSHLSRWIEEHKRLDVAHLELAKFKKYIPEGGIVVDAGASLGDHTCTYAKYVGGNGMVFALEPHPVSFQALKLNFMNYPNVTVFNAALGEVSRHDARMMLASNVGSSFIEAGEGDTWIMKLDDVLWEKIRALDRLDFIHLDCEGWELPALKGGAGIISRLRPVLLLEVAQWVLERCGRTEKDLTDYIASIGYRWEEAEPGCNASFPQRDILCLPL